MREILLPLVKLAEEMGVAILMVSHTNKSASTSAITRVMGSLAFVGVVRVAWLLSEDPERPDRKLLTPIKNNVGRRPTALAFEIADDLVLEFEPEVLNLTADQAPALGGAKETKADSAVEWMQEKLSAGPAESAAMETEARAADLSHWAIAQAKKTLGVKCGRPAGVFGGGFFWSLPQHLDGEGRIVLSSLSGPSSTDNDRTVRGIRSTDRILPVGRSKNVLDGGE